MLSRKLFLFSLILFACVSCRKDLSLYHGQGGLNFSADTVYFDTVFTRIPGGAYPRSINKRFMIRNPFKETVHVNARIMGGSSSQFKINVDGQFGRVISDIEILPKDSSWVFVEATLEPNFLTHPALVRDSIEFETNGGRQYVQLAAYGWDAYYLKDTVFTGSTSLVLTDKPYVIVNAAYVDQGATLTIGAGVHFYSSPNSTFVDTSKKRFNVSALNVLGTLIVNGTQTNPVIFEGDRLDNNYAEKPGQWRGIHFYRGSVNNVITHAIIKNATIGVQVDSLPEAGAYTLRINHSSIRNISAYGILGLTAKILAQNTTISNCGLNTFIGYYGGDYTVQHCSFYTPGNGRRDPHVIFNNILRDENKVVIRTDSLRYVIVNSIIWGPVESELGFDVSPGKLMANRGFDSCIIKTKTPIPGTIARNKDPLFADPNKGDLKIGSNSPAKDHGDPIFILPDDIEEKSRSDGKPDIGAYEL